MTTRPTRSASIPIGPRNSSSLSPSRNLDSVISIPFNFGTPPRPRINTQSIPHRSATADDYRRFTSSYGARSSSAVTSSPPRPTSRSMTSVNGSARRPVRSPSAYEPRVVRREGTVDATCAPSLAQSSRSQRSSGRGTSTQRPVSGYAMPAIHPPASFPRPNYLEYSALRHMLETDPAPSFSRRLESSGHDITMSSAITSSSLDSDEESNVSPPRDLPLAPPPTTFPQDQVLRLPTRWSDQFRHASLSVSADGRDLTYHGASCSGDRDAAAARTTHPIPPACGIYYYEVEIISKGQKGHISIGFAGRDVKLSRLPGWEVNSWGYHGDDGYSFAAEKTGTKYGPTFGTGDVIGCGIDFTTHRAFFTKNSTLLGPVFENVGKEVELYPSIGLRHAGEAVRVNFGHEPFKFDIDYYVLQKRNQIWSKILDTPLNSSLHRICSMEQASSQSSKTPLSDEQSKEVIHKLVLSYLEHHGYIKTVRAFKRQQESESHVPRPPTHSTSWVVVGEDSEMDTVTPRAEAETVDAEATDMLCRTKIVKSVVAGDIDMAIAETKKHYPAVLEAEKGLMSFKLRCRKFVELILEASELKKHMRSTNNARGPGLDLHENHEGVAMQEMDGLYADSMDVDDEVLNNSSPPSTNANGFDSATVPYGGDSRRSLDGMGLLGSTLSRYESALHQAIAYGQTLSNEYKDDTRPEVKQIFKRTFAIVAWEDPLRANGIVADVVGHEAKVALANELNQAILKSQGRPPHPLLETLYRQSAVCVAQLGLMGIGGATFVDMQKEFIDV